MLLLTLSQSKGTSSSRAELAVAGLKVTYSITQNMTVLVRANKCSLLYVSLSDSHASEKREIREKILCSFMACTRKLKN